MGDPSHGFMRGRRRELTRRLAALALFAIACAVSPSLRELVGGEPVSAPASISLLSFCLACLALALVVRSAIGERRARVRPPRQDLGRD